MPQSTGDTHHIYLLSWLFLISGGLAALTPEPSSLWGWVLLANVVVSAVWTGIGYYRALHQRPKWRIIYSIVHLDMFSIYMVILAWRGNGETALGAFFFLLPVVVIGWIGYSYRRRVFSEILQPRSLLSKVLWFLATGAGGGAIVGLVIGKSFPQIALYWMYLVFLLLVLFSHSMWIKAENPNYEPYQE